MRFESKNTVIIRGREIGGLHPLVCLPLVAENTESLLKQATYLVSLKPDIIEWRADSFNNIDDSQYIINVLNKLRKAIGDIPLLFTCRCIWEGGFKEITQTTRMNIIIEILKTGLTDIVDYEISNGVELVNEIKMAVLKYNAKLILSYHNFDRTPEEYNIINKLREACTMGADIAKLVVMPKNYYDILTLLGATLKAREMFVDIPLITSSLGELGVITRIGGGIFGSDVTFAIGKESSGPGQIPVKDLRNAWRILSL